MEQLFLVVDRMSQGIDRHLRLRGQYHTLGHRRLVPLMNGWLACRRL